MNPLIPAILSTILGAAQENTAPAQSQLQTAVRPMPAGTQRAVMAPPSQGYARFDDKLLHLAPGLQIRDTYNRIVMPGTVEQPVAVRYLADASGDVSRVWILTADEAEQPDPQAPIPR